MWLDHVPNTQGIDIRAGEPPCERPRAALPAQFACGVGVFWVIIVRIFFQRKRMVVAIPLRETNPVGRLAARDNDLFDAQLARCFDYIVRTQHVAAEAFRVRDQHVPRVGGEVDHRIRGLDAGAIGAAGGFVVREVEVGGEGVEGLAGVGEVGF